MFQVDGGAPIDLNRLYAMEKRGNIRLGPDQPDRAEHQRLNLLPERLAPDRVAFRLQTEPVVGRGLDEDNREAAFWQLTHGTTLRMRVFFHDDGQQESAVPLAGIAVSLQQLRTIRQLGTNLRRPNP